MTPYYQDDFVTLYCGDCVEILPALPIHDLLLTDPPYGIFKLHDTSGDMFGKRTVYSEDKSAPCWDVRPDSITMGLLLNSARKHFIWGGNYLADMLGVCTGPLIWNKRTGNNSYADGEMAWSDIVGTMRIFTHQWCGAFKDSERGQRALHPTQKPEALMHWCIEKAGKGIKSILDPYAGSGTVGRVAKDRCLVCTLIEINERYCEIIAKRLEQQVLKFG